MINILFYISIFTVVMKLKIGGLCYGDYILAMVFWVKYMNGGELKIRRWTFLMMSIPVIILGGIIIVKIFFFHEIAESISFSTIIKIVLIFLYACVFRVLDFKNLNYRLVTAILAAPLVISLGMYIMPTLQNVVLDLYGLLPYPNSRRYGGIYGNNVNTFGFYATLVLIVCYLFYKYKKIDRCLFIISVLSAVLCIMISGMRAGLIGSIGALVLCNYKKILKKKCISENRILRNLPILVMILVITSVVIIFFPMRISSQNIFERFSFMNFMKQDLGGSNNVFARQFMYWNYVIEGCQNDSFIWGYDITKSFVDIGYMDIVIRYGVIGLFAILIFGIYAYKIAMVGIQRNYVNFFLVFSLLMSLKGVYVADTKYGFLLVFLVCFLKYGVNCPQDKNRIQQNFSMEIV